MILFSLHSFAADHREGYTDAQIKEMLDIFEKYTAPSTEDRIFYRWQTKHSADFLLKNKTYNKAVYSHFMNMPFNADVMMGGRGIYSASDLSSSSGYTGDRDEGALIEILVPKGNRYLDAQNRNLQSEIEKKFNLDVDSALRVAQPNSTAKYSSSYFVLRDPTGVQFRRFDPSHMSDEALIDSYLRISSDTKAGRILKEEAFPYIEKRLDANPGLLLNEGALKLVLKDAKGPELTKLASRILYNSSVTPEAGKRLLETLIRKSEFSKIDWSQVRQSGALPAWAVESLTNAYKNKSVNFKSIYAISKAIPELVPFPELKKMGMDHWETYANDKQRKILVRKALFHWDGPETEARSFFYTIMNRAGVKGGELTPFDWIKPEKNEKFPAWLSTDAKTLPYREDGIRLFTRIREFDPHAISQEDAEAYFRNYQEEWARLRSQESGSRRSVNYEYTKSIAEIPEEFRNAQWKDHYYGLLKQNVVGPDDPLYIKIVSDFQNEKAPSLAMMNAIQYY